MIGLGQSVRCSSWAFSDKVLQEGFHVVGSFEDLTVFPLQGTAVYQLAQVGSV